MKILFGCGLYFGFRGRSEHQDLEKEHIGTGTFQKDHAYGGLPYVSVRVMNDKTNRITLHNSYLRDTGKLMRIPVLDDNPTSSCFGGSLLRYLKKMNNDQRFVHCRSIDVLKRPAQIKIRKALRVSIMRIAGLGKTRSLNFLKKELRF